MHANPEGDVRRGGQQINGGGMSVEWQVVLARPAEVVEEAIWEEFVVGDMVDASLVLEWS